MKFPFKKLNFADLKSSAKRYSFKKVQIRGNIFFDKLPWVGFCPEKEFYFNIDNSAGFLFECEPIEMVDIKTIEQRKEILEYPFPDQTVLSICLYADEHIEKPEGRLFRVFVSVKFPFDIEKFPFDISELRTEIFSILKRKGLNPQICKPDEFLEMLQGIFNDQIQQIDQRYEEDKPLRKQVIYSDTSYQENQKYLKFGSRVYGGLTPLCFGNQQMRGDQGIKWDYDQIKSPFISSTIFLFNGDEEQEEKIEYEVSQVIILISPSEEELESEILVFRKLGERNDILLQKDQRILPLLLLNALPFGFYNIPKSLKQYRRMMRVSLEYGCRLMPF